MNHVVIIGMGSIAHRHLNNIRFLFPKAQITVMSASGRGMNAQTIGVDRVCGSLAEVIDAQPDMAIVASPSTLHMEHVLALIAADIPVMVEKPITADSEQANTLLTAIEKCKVPVAVGYILRYLSSATVMKQALENNVVGRLYHVSVNVGQYLPNWRQGKSYQESVSASKELGGGVLLELSHELDYLQWLFGPLTLHYAHLCNSFDLGLEVEEMADLVLGCGEGTVCTVHMDFLQQVVQRYCHVIGERGRLEWDLVTNSVTLHTPEESRILHSEPNMDRNQMYLNLMTEFTQAVKQNRPVALHVADACKTVELIDQIKQQARWGGFVK